MHNTEDYYDKLGNESKRPTMMAGSSQQKLQFLMLSESEQSKRQKQGASGKKNIKTIKACLIELLNELEDNTNTSASTDSINISTTRIEKVEEETPAITKVKAEPMKLFQELALKKPQFLC